MPKSTSRSYLGGALADIVSVFDGPNGAINAKAIEAGLTPLPPVDKMASDSFDFLDDVHFASLMVAILLHMSLLLILAPCCTYWSKANDFNAHKPEA